MALGSVYLLLKSTWKTLCSNSYVISVTPNCGEDLHIRAKQEDKEIHQLANTQLIKTHGNMLSGPISRQGTQMFSHMSLYVPF